MKIIFSQPGDEIADHAKKLIIEAEQRSKHPRGIARHSAQVAQLCDDCGDTFWHRDDEYGWFTHIGCKKKKDDNGFGF